MKRVDLLIGEVREETENTEYTSEAGVQDSSILRAFNDAQDRIMSLIQAQKPGLFQKEKEFNTVSQQEGYDLPVDIFATHLLEKVEYSENGLPTDYYQLDFGYLGERAPGTTGSPSYYIRRSSRILLNPVPQTSNAKVRLTYVYAIPKLDKRRGRVNEVTLDNVGNTIVSLNLDPTILNTDDAQALIDAEYLCVVDKNGLIKMQAVPIADLNSSSGALTLEAFVFETGETIAVGDYVVAGKYHTTHSQLPDIAERYLLAFAGWRVQKRDSSNDSVEGFAEKSEMENDIVATYSVRGQDVCEVPVLDTQYLGW